MARQKNSILEYYQAQKAKNKKLLNDVSLLYGSNDKVNSEIVKVLYVHQFEPNVSAQSEICNRTLNLLLHTFL